MSNQQSGNDNKAAQLEKQHENFLKELEAKMKEENFTEEQTSEIMNLAKSSEPGDKKAIHKVTELYGKYNSLNHVPVKKELSEIEKLRIESDFEEFIVFAKATQIIPSDADLEEFTESEQSDFVLKFKQWVKKGKPAAVNPLANEEPEKIIRVSRVKEFGKQWLVYVVSGESIPRGIEKVPTYRKVKHPTTGQTVDDKSMVVSTKDKYTIPFSKEAAVELVGRCEKESDSPQFTFKQGGHKITIRTKDNFVRDFDEVIKEARSGIPV